MFLKSKGSRLTTRGTKCAKSYRRGKRRLVYHPRVSTRLRQLSQLERGSLTGVTTTKCRQLTFKDVYSTVSLLCGDSPDGRSLRKVSLFLISRVGEPGSNSVRVGFFSELGTLRGLNTNNRRRANTGRLFSTVSGDTETIGSGRGKGWDFFWGATCHTFIIRRKINFS